VRAGLERAELVVVQEAFVHTETVAFADVLLPAASFGEKDGTMTNSERRIGRVRAAQVPPGAARTDWAIAAGFAERLEVRLAGAPTGRFAWPTAAAIFDEHVLTTAGRDLDITGLSHAVLDARGPQQWPYRAGATTGTARLYEDHVFATPDGRARFAAVHPQVPDDVVDARYPLRLTTGRLRDQWHGMSRTGTVAAAFAHVTEPVLGVHPVDLARRALQDGDLVEVRSRRGALVVPVAVDEDLLRGSAYLPMHWGASALCGAGSTGVNALTNAATCPTSHQPELKFAAVRITRVDAPHRLVGFALAPNDGETALRARLAALGGEHRYASVVLLAAARPGVLVRIAADTPFEATFLAALDAALGLDAPDVLRYDDARRSIARRARIDGDRLVAVRLHGETVAEAWLRDWLVAGTDVKALRARLLLPSAAPPGGFVSRGRIVCTCFGVGEAAIGDTLRAGPADEAAALVNVQRTLRCGTQCGSCGPELQRLVRDACALRGDTRVADPA
jgi:assimilatory nitrate reductase catalytic subunit